MNIRSMKPMLTKDGNVVRKITTQTKSDRGPTRSRYYHRVKENGRTRFVPRLSAPRPTVIRKPLYEVTDDAGNVHQMTKRQAKSVFSPRQVRKALKRMPADLSAKIRDEYQRLRDDRHLDDDELDELEKEFDASQDLELTDEELLGIDRTEDLGDPESEEDDPENAEALPEG